MGRGARGSAHGVVFGRNLRERHGWRCAAVFVFILVGDKVLRCTDHHAVFVRRAREQRDRTGKKRSFFTV